MKISLSEFDTLNDRTSRGPGFNSPTGSDFFTISIQCVFVSQCFIINLIISLACSIIYSDPRTHCLLFRIDDCLRLAKVKLIGHPQTFLYCIMLVAWDTRDGDEISTSLNYPWDRCDPVWRSGKVLDRTSRGPGFNSPTGSDFFTISIQCVFVSQCLIINLINYFTGLYHLFWSSHALLGVSHCLRLAKVKLIGHPQIFLTLKNYQIHHK